MSDDAQRPARPARPARPRRTAAKAKPGASSGPAGATTPEITIVVPTYRRSERLPGLVAALSAQTFDPRRFELVAVDNCSQDDTWETLTALSATVPFTMRLLQTEVNKGPAPARNLGWRSSAAPLVVFLDDDCLPEPEWLAAGVARMQADEQLGVLQGRVRTPHDFDPTTMGAWYHCQIIDEPTPYFEACNIFYRRAALEESRGFDETIGWWCEDTMLGWNVVEAGWGRSFTPDAVVEHAVVARGWKWHFDNGLLEGNIVKVAAAHPGFRQEAFWQPWAFRRNDAGFVVAVVGLVAALRFRPALLLALPYLWFVRPRRGQVDPLRTMATGIIVDASRSASQLRAAVANRVLVI
jgi:GT2 family glycosyltransferase